MQSVELALPVLLVNVPAGHIEPNWLRSGQKRPSGQIVCVVEFGQKYPAGQTRLPFAPVPSQRNPVLHFATEQVVFAYPDHSPAGQFVRTPFWQIVPGAQAVRVPSQ
jgi:hypothetical protein